MIRTARVWMAVGKEEFPPVLRGLNDQPINLLPATGIER